MNKVNIIYNPVTGKYYELKKRKAKHKGKIGDLWEEYRKRKKKRDIVWEIFLWNEEVD